MPRCPPPDSMTRSGVTTKRVSKLSSTGYLSAEMKVVHLFMWSQALGSRGLLLNDAVRSDALTAISSLQIICYSVRGKRPFTEAEHRFIFEVLGRRFWRSLTNIVHEKRQKRIADAEAYNVDKPPSKRRRVPHWKAAEVLSDESEDTASSTDEDVPPYFIRSEKIIPHSFCHFGEQVCMGGTHLFHDTSLAEMTHRDNIGWASLRSRTYHDVNESSVAMLEFLNEDQLLEAICAQAAVDDDSGEDEEESDAGDPNPHHMPTPYAHTIYPHHIPTQYAHTTYPHHIREFSLTLHPHPN